MSNVIVSPPNKCILVPQNKVAGLGLDAPVLMHRGVDYAILPHTTMTQFKLRAVDIEIPPPILHHFNWASADGAVPFEIQKATAALASSHQRAYIINDLGTGKSKASLWAWRYLHEAGVAKKLLIVAPLSTLKFVWWREVTFMMPHCSAVVLHGDRARRLKLLEQDHDVYIINHDGLKTIANELYAREDIDCLILDELAVYRNNSQRSKRMREFAARFVWVWGLTGRPMPNAPTDVWAQCKILTPHTVPKFFRYAQTKLMQQINQYKWVPKEDAIETALSWMQPAVRFALDDVVELPTAIHRTIPVDLSAQQRRTYEILATEFVALIDQQKISAVNAGVALQKLLQVGCGYVYTTNPSYVTIDSEPRRNLLLELIDEAKEKIIVYAPWRHLIDNLSKLLTEQEIDHAVVHGDVTKREQIFNAFQNTPEYRVLLAHPQCVHHGLTLTAATTIIWYSPITSLEVYEQANARIRRVGQSKKQLFLHLQATPVERKVYAMLQNKKKVQDEFLTMLKTVLTKNDKIDGDQNEQQVEGGRA